MKELPLWELDLAMLRRPTAPDDRELLRRLVGRTDQLAELGRYGLAFIHPSGLIPRMLSIIRGRRDRSRFSRRFGHDRDSIAFRLDLWQRLIEASTRTLESDSADQLAQEIRQVSLLRWMQCQAEWLAPISPVAATTLRKSLEELEALIGTGLLTEERTGQYIALVESWIRQASGEGRVTS